MHRHIYICFSSHIRVAFYRIVSIIESSIFAVNCSEKNVTADGIQPLVSNVLRKQMGASAGSGEAQYMQQQSQIFVFSTTLANKGAEAVLRGDYLSIIDYHCAQPGTKKYLEVLHEALNYYLSKYYLDNNLFASIISSLLCFELRKFY